MDAGERLEGVVLPPTYEVTQGEVRVQIDPSLASATLEGLDYLRHYPYESTEGTVSRFLPNAATLSAFNEFGIQDDELEQALDFYVTRALQKLYAEQHVDGGWGWYVSGPSQPTVTAYAVQGMLAAREADVTVEQRVIDDALGYLGGQLRSLDVLDTHSELDRQMYILYVMAKAGEPDASRTGQMYENRAGLQHWARAHLAQTIAISDPGDPRLETLRSDLVNSGIASATGIHWRKIRPTGSTGILIHDPPRSFWTPLRDCGLKANWGRASCVG